MSREDGDPFRASRHLLDIGIVACVVKIGRCIVVVAALAAMVGASGCIVRPTASDVSLPTTNVPSSSAGPQASASPNNSVEPARDLCESFVNGSTSWFDGTCHGWRVATHDVLEAQGLHSRNLQLDCDPDLYGDSLETSGPPAVDHFTDLDIEFTEVPSGAAVVHVMKWACGTRGVSDLLRLTLDDGSVSVERALRGRPSMEVEAVDGSVASCDVLGRPAICVDRLTADAIAQVMVIEDGTFDPHAVVLRLSSEDVSLATLLDIAARVVKG